MVIGPTSVNDAVVSHFRLNDPLTYKMLVREARSKVVDQELYLSYSRTLEEADAIIATVFFYDYMKSVTSDDPFAENGIETVRQVFVVGSNLYPTTTARSYA
jgi:hypothetical protein